jgi:hypothetical protein
MKAQSPPSGQIASGSFIRVRADHPSFRAGKDGMVHEDMGDEIALTFGFDRYNESQGCHCVGPELWSKFELDLGSVEPT